MRNLDIETVHNYSPDDKRRVASVWGCFTSYRFLSESTDNQVERYFRDQQTISERKGDINWKPFLCFCAIGHFSLHSWKLQERTKLFRWACHYIKWSNMAGFRATTGIIPFPYRPMNVAFSSLPASAYFRPRLVKTLSLRTRYLVWTF